MDLSLAACRPRSGPGALAALTALFVSLASQTPLGAQGPAGTDIWAFRISELPEIEPGVRAPGLSVDLTSAVRVTNRPGYDNQPHFIPGERLVYYTAIDSTGQADIWGYDLRNGSRRNVTRTTPESEYSATVLPSLTRFSAIRVEADSAQRLWSFSSTGDNPEVVLEDVQPVGYHAWLNADTVALYVLGEPATLQIASVSEGTAEVVAEDIGRSLHRMPGTEGTSVSFVQWVEPGRGYITEYDPDSGEKTPLAFLLEGNEFFTFFGRGPSGMLLMGQGSKLFGWVPGVSDAWFEIADLGPAGVVGITRIALSHEGGWMAVVAEDGA